MTGTHKAAQSLFIQNSSGNFIWNHYAIEGQAQPVPALSNYLFKRDDNATGAWNTIQNLSASSLAYTDVQYATYQLQRIGVLKRNGRLLVIPLLNLMVLIIRKGQLLNHVPI